ncbi:MAG TPA: alpha-amylase family glycosyl hydrolase [Candidatus Limnocylindrales bacterium]|nr:alpha-amylase family glycosyl hydrolase [Candidatus Limnocylindrales bacterium]
MADALTERRGSFWREGVLYQVYPRSFADSDGDGVGDLAGIIAHLDHLQWLGVDGIWLNPITVSPDQDMGYDVADYTAVQPRFGTLATVDALIAEAARRDIRVLLDLVPNHTSDQHPWFRDARSARTARHRDWYLWADPRPDGSPPNNWVSHFGGPAWTFDQGSGQYYLHSFDPAQPDLNWRNPEVVLEFDHILRFWFDRGVAGFRIDVAHGMIKDRLLRDNPEPAAEDPPRVRKHGQRLVHNFDQPEVHEILRRWRRLADSYNPRRVLIGETDVPDVERLRRYYSDGDELHLAFNFPFMHAPFELERLRAIADATQAAMHPHGWPVWTISNHDVSRFPSRWCQGDPRKIRCALMMLLTLRGTPVLYYGDELGMPDTPVPFEAMLDPIAKRNWPERTGRDPARTPMPWTPEPGAGFTRPQVRPWLPFGDLQACNVAAERQDPGSVLHFVRDLIRLRRQRADLHQGDSRPAGAPAGCWAWRRGASTLVALNLSDRAVSVAGVRGAIRLGTVRGRTGATLGGALTLGPWEGVVVDESPPGGGGHG